jgi:hypothetical protein
LFGVGHFVLDYFQITGATTYSLERCRKLNVFRKNLWRSGAAFWVDVRSKSAKIGLVYWIRGNEDNRRGREKGDRGGGEVRVRGGRRDVTVFVGS